MRSLVLPSHALVDCAVVMTLEELVDVPLLAREFVDALEGLDGLVLRDELGHRLAMRQAVRVVEVFLDRGEAALE